MRDNHIKAHLVFIAVVMTLYFGDIVTAEQSSSGLALALQATKLCINVKKKPEFKPISYDECLRNNLEPMVWVLVEKKEIDLNKCKADKTVESENAWCFVWIKWWIWGDILITNKRLIEYIRAPADNKPAIPRREDEIKAVLRQPFTAKTMPTLNEYAKFKVQQKKEDVTESVTNLVEKLEDVKDNVEKQAQSYQDRVKNVATELTERVSKTGNLALASVQDFRDKVKETWSKPLPGFEKQKKSKERHY